MLDGSEVVAMSVPVAVDAARGRTRIGASPCCGCPCVPNSGLGEEPGGTKCDGRSLPADPWIVGRRTVEHVELDGSEE
jgi:hypothetical protein